MNEIKGVYKIEFINGEIKEVEVKRFIFYNPRSSLYLEGVDGRFYYWEYVVSVKKE
jgi:uncharacterized protein YxjI